MCMSGGGGERERERERIIVKLLQIEFGAWEDDIFLQRGFTFASARKIRTLTIQDHINPISVIDRIKAKLQAVCRALYLHFFLFCG